jgi:hypothetical protein
MGRTGSIAKVAREGAFSTACVGFCAAARGGFSEATRTGFSALVRTDSVRSFRVFLEIDGAVFAVITWTTSFVASSLRLSPPKLAGAKPWARAPALNVTETNAVASAMKNGRLRTSARYAGNRNPWQAFFFDKNRWRLVSYRGRDFDVRATMPPRFNSRGNNRAQIRAEDRTSGRDQCTLDSDGGAPIHRRLGRR